MRRQLVSTSLGQIHCVTAGPSGAPPLVLLHQTPRSVDEFAEVLPLLARERAVIAVDTPGYGASDAPLAPPSIADYAASVLELLDALGVPAAVPVGHHTGAVIAIELAARAPQRIPHVVLSGPIYIDGGKRGEWRNAFVQWRVDADGAHLGEAWRRMTKWTDDAHLRQRIVLDGLRAGETSEYGHHAVAAYRMEDRLQELRCGATLVYATDDPFATRAQAAPLAAAFNPCREFTIEAGVFAPNEAPEAFARAVLYGISSLDRLG